LSYALSPLRFVVQYEQKRSGGGGGDGVGGMMMVMIKKRVEHRGEICKNERKWHLNEKRAKVRRMEWIKNRNIHTTICLLPFKDTHTHTQTRG
jgi:hypothetical protein